MYITVCYDKAQTMLELFIYFKYLRVDLVVCIDLRNYHFGCFELYSTR